MIHSLVQLLESQEHLPENSTQLKLDVALFDSAVGATEDVKVQPIQTGELL